MAEDDRRFFTYGSAQTSQMFGEGHGRSVTYPDRPRRTEIIHRYQSPSSRNLMVVTHDGA